MAGYFGFATYALYPDVDTIMEDKNILEVLYVGNVLYIASQLMLLASVILASSLYLMPVKDKIEELYLGPDRIMNGIQNVLVTLLIVMT